MKKAHRFAIGLLIMGTILFPGCDEGGKDGKGLLPLIMLYNSQYYIEFDAEHDNAPGVVEHVKMGVKSHFIIDPINDWYRCKFSGNNNEFLVILPSNTSELDTYTEPLSNFSFSYTYLDTGYISDLKNNFTCEIIQWNGKGTEAYAEFSGILSSGSPIDEQLIQITNGNLYARILD